MQLGRISYVLIVYCFHFILFVVASVGSRLKAARAYLSNFSDQVDADLILATVIGADILLEGHLDYMKCRPLHDKALMYLNTSLKGTNVEMVKLLTLVSRTRASSDEEEVVLDDEQKQPQDERASPTDDIDREKEPVSPSEKEKVTPPADSIDELTVPILREMQILDGSIDPPLLLCKGNFLP